jgi:hypothetical protein
VANDFFKYLSLYGLKDTWEAAIYNNSLNKDFKKNENIKEDFLKNLSYYEISDLEAQNFNMQIYEKAINTLLYKAKQENLKDKLKKIEKDFK